MKKKMQQIAIILICLIFSFIGMAYQYQKYQESKGKTLWSYFTEKEAANEQEGGQGSVD